MGKMILTAGLLAATGLGAPAPALAQDAQSDLAAEVAAMRAKIESLEAKVKELESGQQKAAAALPSWKGAPQWDDKQDGFSFKARGMLQLDAGYVGTPGPELSGTVGGLNYNNLGWSARARRAIIGLEGTLPGGFGYRAEFNFAQSTVDYEDVLITYQPDGSPLQVTVGNTFPLSSLETITSSRLTSFLERAAFTDAFNYNRRLGVSAGLVDLKDTYTLTAGVWSQEINNNIFNRTAWQASVRGTYSPILGSTRLHLGANFQHRVAQRDVQNVQYRSRPFTQVTDQRFVDTGAIAADGDDIAGLEFAAIMKSFHFAGEAQKVWVRGYRPGEAFGPNNGAGNGVFYADDPTFVGGYAEIGYYLTGETRGYKAGRWDRTKVLKPFSKGGWGALQANLRLDYHDLRDQVADGAALDAPNLVNGGRQLGYQASLIWNPTDYLRFQAQYSHGAYTGGPRAATVDPSSPDPIDERDFDADSLAVRAQVDF